MKNKVVISGDIISFTSLSNENKYILESELQILITIIHDKFNSFARIIKGDYLECVLHNSKDALRVSILIKTFIKSVHIKIEKESKKEKLFKTFGIRLAVGYGEISRLNTETGIIDGEAIYLSGRKINSEHTHNKSRTIIKNTLFFVSKNEKLNKQMQVIFTLLDFVINNATAKQCKIIYLKLLNFTEEQIAKKMSISQSAINQHSTSAGWSKIELAINYFEQQLKN